MTPVNSTDEYYIGGQPATIAELRAILERYPDHYKVEKIQFNCFDGNGQGKVAIRFEHRK